MMEGPPAIKGTKRPTAVSLYRDERRLSGEDARGYLGDGELSLRESGEYAHEILIELGYESTLTVMTGATHDSWGDEGRAIVVDTAVMAAKQ